MTYFVSRGRTIVVDGAEHGFGEQVTLLADEAERLTRLGFVQNTPPVLMPPPANNPSGIGLRNSFVQGPTFTQ